MTFYYLIFFIILLFLLIRYGVKQKAFFEYLVIFILAILCGIRIEIGADFKSYQDIFVTLPVNYYKVEYGFFFLGKMVKFLGLDYHFFLFFLSLIMFLTLRKSIKLLELDYTISFIVYLGYFFLTYQFNTLRHGLMVSFVWLGAAYLIKGKQLHFLIFVYLGLLFHKIAFIGLLFWFVQNWNFRIRHILVFLPMAILVGFVFDIPHLFSYFPKETSIGYKIHYYLNVYYKNIGQQSPRNYGISVGTILNITILITSLIIGHDKKDDKLARILNVSLFIGICGVFVFNSVSIFVERFSNLFYFSLVFLLPHFIKRVKISGNKIIITTCIIVLCFFYWHKILSSSISVNKSPYVPYKSILHNKISDS